MTPPAPSPAPGKDERGRAFVPYLLWIDCGGAFVVGAVMFLAADWLRGLFQLPPALYLTIATANVAYGCFSFVLALLRKKSPALIAALAVANALWGCVCLVLVAVVWGEASVFGLIHILTEAAVVFTLARAEWKHRAQLADLRVR
jgi:hypothetical protein